VEVIDEDLGLSASIGAKRREGFERLLASMALGEVGIIFGREVSRLSRNDKDWCRLIEVCQIFDTLIADAERIYDLASMDDHLVERVLPAVAVRQYVLSPPSELVGLLAARGEALSSLSRIFVEAIFGSMRKRSGRELSCGAVVVFQRFNKAITVYPHLHVLVLDGGYVEHEDGTLDFVEVATPRAATLREIEARVGTRFSRWLKRHGFLDDEPPEPEPDDGW